jgi:hypothetical protein
VRHPLGWDIGKDLHDVLSTFLLIVVFDDMPMDAYALRTEFERVPEITRLFPDQRIEPVVSVRDDEYAARA